MGWMEQLRRGIDFLRHGIWRIDRDHDSRLHAFLVEALRVAQLVWRGAKEDACGLRAAALTYSTLMAMVPFLVIVFSIGKAIGFTKAEQWILDATREMPEQIQQFVRHVLDIVQSINPALLGSAGAAVFLVVVFGLLNRIEESFNHIWGVRSSRSIADKIRNYFSVLVITPVLALLANAGSAALLAYAARSGWMGRIVTLAMQAAPAVLLALAFVAVFMFLPHTRVRFYAALTGGLVSAVLVLIAQYVVLKFSSVLFHKYAIYGSFASIPVFLYWLYLNWTILLYGAELAFAIQNRNTYAEERVVRRASIKAKLMAAFAVMAEAVRVFRDPARRALDLEAFARANRIPVRLVNEVAEVLEEGGLLNKIENEENDALYVLAQAPEKVTARHIFEFFLSRGASPAELGIDRLRAARELYAVLEKGAAAALDSVTLKDFPDDGNLSDSTS